MPAISKVIQGAKILVLLLIAVHVIFICISNNRIIRSLDNDVGKSTQRSFATQLSNWPKNTPSADDIKIIAFADKHYVALAKVWYERLSSLGYNTHYIVCVDDHSFKKLSQGNYRLIQRYVTNPDYAHPVVGFGRQLYSLRLQFTLEMLQNGTHVLVTDVDNIFNRYISLAAILKEPFHLFHAYEMKYPTYLFQERGFVVCAGHQFLRSSPATISYLRDEVLADCFKTSTCDDQVRYNVALHKLNVNWNKNPFGEDRIKISSNNTENDGLLVEELQGTTHNMGDSKLRIKIWNRDFAWRLSNDLPEKCPSKDNWVSMPTKIEEHITEKRFNKVWKKIETFRVWDDLCRGGERII